MEDIKFFGKTITSSNRLVRDVCSLMENKKLNNNNIYYPHTYIYTIKEAKEMYQESFEWPVVFKIASNNGNIYSKSTLLDSLYNFNTRVNEISDEDSDATILISKPIRIRKDLYSNYHLLTDYYLAKDYLLIHNKHNNFSFVINTNNHYGFKSVGLDPTLVYRLTQSRLQDCTYKFVIENIFNYDDERLAEIKKNTYKSIIFDDSMWLDFVEGYRAGKSENNKDKVIEDIPSRNIDTSYVTNGYNFGLILSLKINHIMRACTIKGNDDRYDLSKIFCFKKIIGESAINEMRLAANLHNSIMSTDKQNVLKHIKNVLPNRKKLNIKKLLDEAYKIGLAAWMNYNAENESGKVIPELVFNKLFIMPDENDEGCFEVNLDLKNAQFRVLNSENKFVSIRVQIEEFNTSTKINFKNKKSKEISSITHGKFEHDIHVNEEDLNNFDGPKNVKELLNKFTEMGHTEKSQAKTDQMYVPVKVVGDNFVEIKTGDLVMPKSLLVNYCVKRGIIDLPDNL